MYHMDAELKNAKTEWSPAPLTVAVSLQSVL